MSESKKVQELAREFREACAPLLKQVADSGKIGIELDGIEIMFLTALAKYKEKIMPTG